MGLLLAQTASLGWLCTPTDLICACFGKPAYVTTAWTSSPAAQQYTSLWMCRPPASGFACSKLVASRSADKITEMLQHGAEKPKSYAWAS